MFDDTTIPSRVHASTSMCGYTLRWLISRRRGSRSSNSPRIGVRSRISTSASVSRSRSASAAVSCTWSFHTITSCPSSLRKQSSVRSVLK
jgi:hypothetical protein